MPDKKRANPDRIDFRILSAGITVTKFDHTGDRCIPWEAGCEVKEGWSEAELEKALDWCANNNYVVRRWPKGARAFKGELFVIRTRGQIKRMRAQLSRRGTGFFFDLRYDL